MKPELAQPCEVCKAKRGEDCRNTIEPGKPLPGRKQHIGRTEKRC